MSTSAHAHLAAALLSGLVAQRGIEQPTLGEVYMPPGDGVHINRLAQHLLDAFVVQQSWHVPATRPTAHPHPVFSSEHDALAHLRTAEPDATLWTGWTYASALEKVDLPPDATPAAAAPHQGAATPTHAETGTGVGGPAIGDLSQTLSSLVVDYWQQNNSEDAEFSIDSPEELAVYLESALRYMTPENTEPPSAQDSPTEAKTPEPAGSEDAVEVAKAVAFANTLPAALQTYMSHVKQSFTYPFTVAAAMALNEFLLGEIQQNPHSHHMISQALTAATMHLAAAQSARDAHIKPGITERVNAALKSALRDALNERQELFEDIEPGLVLVAGGIDTHSVSERLINELGIHRPWPTIDSFSKWRAFDIRELIATAIWQTFLDKGYADDPGSDELVHASRTAADNLMDALQLRQTWSVYSQSAPAAAVAGPFNDFDTAEAQATKGDIEDDSPPHHFVRPSVHSGPFWATPKTPR